MMRCDAIWVWTNFLDIYLIRLSNKHLLYGLGSIFDMVPSPAFNVLMLICSLPPPFFLMYFFWGSMHYGGLVTVV